MGSSTCRPGGRIANGGILPAAVPDDEQIVRRFFEELVGGPAALERIAHEDVVYVEDPVWPGAGTYQGRPAVVECWSRYDELLGVDAALDVAEVSASGGAVVAVVRMRGRARDSGVPYDHTWGYVCRTREGRVAYFRAYFDPSEARREVGVPDRPG